MLATAVRLSVGYEVQEIEEGEGKGGLRSSVGGGWRSLRGWIAGPERI